MSMPSFQNMVKDNRRTSFPGAMSLSATRLSDGSLLEGVPCALGNTMTAFGLHEWFANATVGATQIPMGDSDAEVSVNVFVVNCKRARVSRGYPTYEDKGRRNLRGR